MKVAEVQPLIKDWMAIERPREKLFDEGPRKLTEVELLAIILTTGTRGRNCLDISRKMLAIANNDLNTLAELPISALEAIHGIGKAKAAIVCAALELRRRNENVSPERPMIVSSKDAYSQLKSELSNLDHEEFWVLYLNQGSKLLLKKQISSGGTSSTVVDPRIIFGYALEKKTTSTIILAHNHPSGNLVPSQADMDLTERIIAAGKLFDIQVVDHLILAGKNYCSFADSGLM
jgi:DNA repair protein RadC